MLATLTGFRNQRMDATTATTPFTLPSTCAGEWVMVGHHAQPKSQYCRLEKRSMSRWRLAQARWSRVLPGS